MGYLKIAMKNVQCVQCLESDDSLYQYTPNLAFLEEFFFLLAVYDLLVEVSVISILHDNAKYRGKYHRFLPYKNASLYPTMLLFFRLAKIRT